MKRGDGLWRFACGDVYLTWQRLRHALCPLNIGLDLDFETNCFFLNLFHFLIHFIQLFISLHFMLMAFHLISFHFNLLWSNGKVCIPPFCWRSQRRQFISFLARHQNHISRKIIFLGETFVNTIFKVYFSHQKTSWDQNTKFGQDWILAALDGSQSRSESKQTCILKIESLWWKLFSWRAKSKQSFLNVIFRSVVQILKTSLPQNTTWNLEEEKSQRNY